MTPLFPQKPQRLRARRRKIRLITFCICVLLGASLVGGAGLASHAERFAIKDVSVSGAQELSTNTLTAAVEAGLQNNMFKIFSRRNMFLYPRSEIEQNLSDTFPRIKNVELSRASLMAQAIMVTVEERKPFAKWCDKDGKCFFLDDIGFIFAEAEEGKEMQTAYVFRAGLIPETSPIGQAFLRGRLGGIVHFLDLLTQAGYKPQGIHVENEKDFSVPQTDGPRLLIPFDLDPEKMVHDLQLALEADSVRGRESELEYIDLRFGNRVYYKYK